MKKLLALILVLAMAASVVACGGGGSSSATAEDGGTVTVWCWDPAFNLYAMEQAAAVYRPMNDKFEIDIVEIGWGDIQTALITNATAGTLENLPDIFLCQDNAFQLNVMNFPEIFTDLTDSGINFSQFAAGKVAYSVIDGQNFGVPFDNGATVAALRVDVLEEAGFSIADFTDITWDQFISQGKQVLEITGRPMISTTAGGGDFITFMLQSAGLSLFNADGSPNIAGNAGIEQAIGIYLELVQTGVLLEVNDWDEYIGSFVNNIVTGTISGCWILGSVQEAQDQSGLWRVTNIPRIDRPGGTNYSNWGGSSWAVTTSSENPALAIDFLANTFAGSVEFYERILERSGAIGTWAPAAASTVYSNPQEFFGGQAVFADIVRFAGNVPSIITGVYFYEANSAVSQAVVDILGGADIAGRLQQAQEQVEFQMG